MSEWVSDILWYCVNFWDVQKYIFLKLTCVSGLSEWLVGFKEALYDYTGLGPPIRNYFECHTVSYRDSSPKMKIVTHIVPNLYGFISSLEHNKGENIYKNI